MLNIYIAGLDFRLQARKNKYKLSIIFKHYEKDFAFNPGSDKALHLFLRKAVFSTILTIKRISVSVELLTCLCRANLQ